MFLLKQIYIDKRVFFFFFFNHVNFASKDIICFSLKYSISHVLSGIKHSKYIDVPTVFWRHIHQFQKEDQFGFASCRSLQNLHVLPRNVSAIFNICHQIYRFCIKNLVRTKFKSSVSLFILFSNLIIIIVTHHSFYIFNKV